MTWEELRNRDEPATYAAPVEPAASDREPESGGDRPLWEQLRLRWILAAAFDRRARRG
jgi:hypothetical protein